MRTSSSQRYPGDRCILNFNDALVVVLKRKGVIDRLASFDPGFDVIPDFERLS
jgi:predicted nucleic acid-binding protein